MAVSRDMRSKQVYAIKAFAIFSVICAHMKLQLEYGSTGWLSDKIISIFGIFGVPVFLICSGYYYHRDKNGTIAFWQKKMKNIIVPWMIWATVTSVLQAIIQNQKITINRFILWFTGYNSLYYFLSVLIFCFFVFNLCDNKIYMIVVGLISVTANILIVLNSGGGIT